MANTKITSANLDTLTTLTVDDITIDGSTISDSGDLTLDVGGDIVLDAAGGDISLKNAGDEAGKIVIGDATDPRITLDVTGDIYLDADGGDIIFADGGTQIADFENSSSDFKISSLVSNKDLILGGNDNGTFINALTLDMSEAGAATFNSNATVSGIFKLAASRSTYVDASEDATAHSHMFVTNDGVGDFSQEAGHLVIQARTHTSVYRDIIFAGGINNASDLMRIRGEGNVGINCAGSNAKLEVVATSGEVFRADSNNGAYRLVVNQTGANMQGVVDILGTGLIHGVSNYTGLEVKGTGSARPMIQWSNVNQGDLGAIYGTEGNDLVICSGSSNAAAITIDSSQNVGIGETNPSLKLMVQENDASKQVLMVRNQASTVSNSTAALVYLQYNGDSSLGDGSKFIHFVDSDTNLGQITSTNSSTGVSYGSNSDERLKKNIVDASSQLDVVKSVKVREYDWKKNDKHELGFIAQELKTSIPQAVIEGGDDETENPWGVDYGRVTPYLVKAIQEQQEQIEALQKEVEELKGG